MGKMENEQLMRRLGLWALISGVLSVVFYILHDFIGGMYYPGYDRMSQAVSDLTAVDAPSFVIAGGLSKVYGIFSCLCCAFLCVMVENVRKSLRLGVYLFAAMNGISAVGYSLFPLTGSGYDGSVRSFIHVYVVTVPVVLFSIASLILIAAGSFRDNRKTLGIFAVIALLCMAFGAAGSANVPREVFGMVERCSTYSAVVFTGILGVYWYLESVKNLNASQA